MKKNNDEKRLVGRPKKFNSAEELQEKIDEYFDGCFEPEFNKFGRYVINPFTGMPKMKQIRPFTISGLANALDMSRHTLLNYSKEDEFFPTIMQAKRKCEQYAEERLYDKDGNRGAIFSLMNNYDDWKQKQEVAGTIGVGTIEEYTKKVEDENEY